MSAVEYTHWNDMLISLRDMLMEAQMGSRRTVLLMLNLGARRGEVFNAKPQPFYPGE
jgi:hypothetical protein